jgi:hypothetical protein
VAAIPPVQRLALRTHPATHAIINATRIHQTIAHASATALDLTHALDHARDLAGAPTRDRARAIPHVRARTLASARLLDHSRDLAHTLTIALLRDLDHPVLTRDHDLARAIAIARDLAHDLARDDDHNHDSDHDRTLDHDRTRTHARALERALGIALERSLDLDRTAARPCAQSLDRASGGPYGLEAVHEQLGSVLAEGALDDVTNADLHQTDLTHTDLTGLRWTLHSTLWPPGIDTAQLLGRSIEETSGSGVYTVTSGPEITARETVSV